MKINKRPEINKFLIELDKFISKYYTTIDDIYWVEDVFIPIFKANKDNKSFVSPDKRWLEIPILTALCNVHKTSHLSKRNKNKLIEQFDKLRKSTFVQWVAYKFKYKLVNDVSYEHIFIKYLLQESNKADILFPILHKYQWYLWKLDLRDFLIPIDWEINNDLIIY